jgi:hypothetical protein
LSRQWRDGRLAGDAPAVLSRGEGTLDGAAVVTAHLADAGSPAVDQPNPHVPESLGDTLVNLVAGEPGQLAPRVADDHLCFTVSERREGAVTHGEQVITATHRAGSTRTFWKRHGAAP